MKSCLVMAVLMFLTVPSAFAGGHCFPGNERALSSPSHNYQLTWKKGSRDSEGVKTHHLLFSRKGEKEPKDFFEFYNEACIHWSPDEKYFSVSHLVGSNIAEDFIFESDDVTRRVDVMDTLPEQVRNYFRKGVIHGYIETTAWNKDGMLIRAWGDRESNPRTFDVALKCTVNQGKWTCKRVSK